MIKAVNITKVFGSVKVLSEVSLHVGRAESLVVMGPSGSGKTTLLRIIAGLERPDAGEIYLDGSLVSTNKWRLAPHLRNIGFVFQTPALWPHMTIRENIIFGLGSIPKRQALERADHLLETAGILHTANRFPGQISGGEAKRAAIVRSIAPKPAIILMDEPLVNLDAKVKNQLFEYILKVTAAERTTLVYVTHDAAEAAKISGNILYMRGCK
ncbi:MAG: ABC transporter ATP-binding protein [Negativicutes bacterium]|nr:ABC transporter ATP-binding protein [Negativicutes bacterium]